MPVPSSMADLSTTAASNSPAGTDSPTTGDDYLRSIQAIIRTTNAKGADIASAATTDIGAATGEFVDVTGTTTITALGTVAAGIVRTVRFTGALTLTYNATSLQLPGAANITTANGDVAQFRSLGSGNWKCVGYMKADGTAIVSSISDGDKGDITVSGSGGTWTIDNDAVTYAKMQNVSATSRILGRKTAAAGDTEECTLSEVLDFIGSAAQGDILYRDASGWARLGAGTSGHYLKTQGAGANPAWASVAASGTLIGYQVFTSTGSYTKATNNPSFVVVEVIGGGGGGGGASATNYHAGGGGGGGGYVMEKIAASSLAASETVTIGAGGTAGANTGGDGGTGGTSSFGAFCSATGGSGGAGGGSTTNVSLGGDGGAGSGGGYNSTGGCGAYSQPSSTLGVSVSGAGGSSSKGGGGNGLATNGTGNSATANTGGGGGGGLGASGNGRAGGAGGSGVVIVWEYA